MRRLRTDKNQAEIVAALRKLGCSVVPIMARTAGCPDLLVGFRGKNYLVEVKVPKTGRLSLAQKEWRAEWRGSKPFVITSSDDVIWFIKLVDGFSEVWLGKELR